MFKFSVLYGKAVGEIEYMTLYNFEPGLSGYADYFKKILFSKRGMTVIFKDVNPQTIEDEVLNELSLRMPLNQLFIPFEIDGEYEMLVAELQPFWTVRLAESQKRLLQGDIIKIINKKIKKFYKIVDTI